MGVNFDRFGGADAWDRYCAAEEHRLRLRYGDDYEDARCETCSLWANENEVKNQQNNAELDGNDGWCVKWEQPCGSANTDDIHECFEWYDGRYFPEPTDWRLR